LAWSIGGLSLHAGRPAFIDYFEPMAREFPASAALDFGAMALLLCPIVLWLFRFRLITAHPGSSTGSGVGSLPKAHKRPKANAPALPVEVAVP
jgi:hypothetical protein